MKYMDAWHLIAPTISNKLLNTKEGAEAYVMLFGALNTMEGGLIEKDHDGCDGCRYIDKKNHEQPCVNCKCCYIDRYESNI